MSLTLDHRNLPEDLRDEILSAGPGPGGPPKDDGPAGDGPQTEKVTGQAIFSLPEPDMEWADGVRKLDCMVAGIPGLSITTEGARRDYVFMHIHGGGFTGGNPVSAYRLMDALKRRFGIDSYSVIYTLVPNAAAEQMVNECLAFYRGLKELGYEKIIVGGESAGASLSLAMVLELKRLGLQLPEVVISSSVPADLSGTIDRGEPEDLSMGLQYAGGLSLKDYRVSPYFGDFNGFPPMLMQTGQLENLKFDSIALGEKLKNENCDATLSIWEGGFHAFGIDPGDTWIHRNALKQILDFIDEKTEITR